MRKLRRENYCLIPASLSTQKCQKGFKVNLFQIVFQSPFCMVINSQAIFTAISHWSVAECIFKHSLSFKVLPVSSLLEGKWTQIIVPELWISFLLAFNKKKYLLFLTILKRVWRNEVYDEYEYEHRYYCPAPISKLKGGEEDSNSLTVKSIYILFSRGSYSQLYLVCTMELWSLLNRKKI